MSNGFVKVTLIGNLGKDPELKHTTNGTPVCNISVACTEKRKNKDGNWEDQTEWVRVTCWGKTAENVSSYCTKGKQVYIEGKLQTREWTDKEGVKRTSTEVNGFQVLFLGGGKGGKSSEKGGDETSPITGDATPPNHADAPPVEDDQIPF